VGLVVDTVFVGSKQAYMLSDDNLLTYFSNMVSAKPAWRKELPTTVGGESYKLIHVDETLIAYSNERAIMLNTNGQVMFEIPITGQGKTVAEFYRNLNGELVSVFVRNEKVFVLKSS